MSLPRTPAHQEGRGREGGREESARRGGREERERLERKGWSKERYRRGWSKESGRRVAGESARGVDEASGPLPLAPRLKVLC